MKRIVFRECHRESVCINENNCNIHLKFFEYFVVEFTLMLSYNITLRIIIFDFKVY